MPRLSNLPRMTDRDRDAGHVASDLPGEPLQSGFQFHPAHDVLSAEARQRVFEKMESVDEARLRAARDGHTSYVG